jgi:uncharacterized protein (TIGR02646 family)
MRPVSKGNQPYLYTNGQPYGKAADGLSARIGSYCSYCERLLDHGREVEHLQPKSVAANAALETQWSNFLLACKNCNATKSKHNPGLDEWLIPDRDNTMAAFVYQVDGLIAVEPALPALTIVLAEKTLDLMKLNREVTEVVDEKGNLVALDRRNQRMQAWLLAQRWVQKYRVNPSADISDAIVDLATTGGFFSIWMSAFLAVPAIRQRLIDADAFRGTEKTCFDAATAANVPHPNTDGWLHGGKL